MLASRVKSSKGIIFSHVFCAGLLFFYSHMLCDASVAFNVNLKHEFRATQHEKNSSLGILLLQASRFRSLLVHTRQSHSPGRTSVAA